MLTSDVLHGTTMRQSVDRCVNALLQCKLRSNTLQIFHTDSCVFIRQIQLLALRLTGQGIGYYVQQSLPVQYSDGQLIHMFEPTCLTSAKIWLHKYMLPQFVISINRGRYTIYVTPPFDIRLENRQQFFLAPTIVAFHRSVLATMVRNGVQTISIFLQQHCTSCIFTSSVSITNGLSKSGSFSTGVLHSSSRSFTNGTSCSAPQFHGCLGLAKSVSGAEMSA